MKFRELLQIYPRFRRKVEPVRYVVIHPVSPGADFLYVSREGSAYVDDICLCAGPDRAANARLIADALNKLGR